MKRATLLAAAVLAAAIGLAACEPIGPLAGGRLSGEVVATPVADWSFTDRIDTIQVETRPDDPHSVTTWCVADGATIYVPARDPDGKTWVRNVTEDPRVRLRIDGKLYERRAVRVTDPGEMQAVGERILAKYKLERPAEGERPQLAFFRMEPR